MHCFLVSMDHPEAGLTTSAGDAAGVGAAAAGAGVGAEGGERPDMELL